MTIALDPDVRVTIDEVLVTRPHLAATLERLDPNRAGPHRRTLLRLVEVLEALPATSEAGWRAAALANLFGIVSRGDASDYEETALLYRAVGRKLVDTLARFDELVGVAPGRPFVTATILKLAAGDQVRELLLRAGHADAEADQLVADCGEAAFWLLMRGVDNAPPAPIPDSPQVLRLLLERRGVGVWRSVLANIAANPFGPAPGRLADLAHDAGLPTVARAVDACTRVYRKRFEDAERLEVAREIRSLVADSGCSQRRFAKYIGTSPPRLSTYVNGLVTPSASMMLRIRRCAAELTPPSSPYDDPSALRR